MTPEAASRVRRGRSTAATTSFAARVRAATGAPLCGLTVDTFQVNIGLRCNLACHHCHVESSPARREEMSKETMELVLAAARRAGASTLDVTGGAPELHPHFRAFVTAAVAEGLHVIVRSNLTVLTLPDQEDLPELFAELGLHVVASLPCYLEENVEKQRGRHVYNESVTALQRLNALGYGTGGRLELDLIYNPGGASLPPDQDALEAAYRRELAQRFGIRFGRLYAIANMPVGRFRRDLEKSGHFAAYDRLLRAAFNAATLDGLMCRHQVHVGWDGTLYDCDFNFALDLPARASGGHIRAFDAAAFLARSVGTGAHCFGCTAGSGSSCKGSLA